MMEEDDVNREVSDTSDNGTMSFSSNFAQLDYSLKTLFPCNPNTGDLMPVTDLVVKIWRRFWRSFLERMAEQPSSKTEKSIFISYAWASQSYHPEYNFVKYTYYEHVVKKIATDCERAGFTVHFDRWVDKGYKSIDAFLETLMDVDICLVIGTLLYLHKYTKHRPEGDHIIGAEARLLNSMSTSGQSHAEKIYPLILEGNQETSIPPLLRKNASGYWLTQDGIQNYFKMMLKVFRDAWDVDNKKFEKIEKKVYAILRLISEKITEPERTQFTSPNRQEYNALLAEQVSTIKTAIQKALKAPPLPCDDSHSTQTPDVTTTPQTAVCGNQPIFPNSHNSDRKTPTTSFMVKWPHDYKAPKSLNGFIKEDYILISSGDEKTSLSCLFKGVHVINKFTGKIPSKVQGLDMTNECLADVNFSDLVFCNLTLRESKLTDVIFSNSSIFGGFFCKASLTNVNFDKSILEGCNFTEATFVSGNTFKDAIIRNATFRGTNNLPIKALKKAKEFGFLGKESTEGSEAYNKLKEIQDIVHSPKTAIKIAFGQLAKVYEASFYFFEFLANVITTISDADDNPADTPQSPSSPLGGRH